MSYYDSAEGETISLARVMQELATHGVIDTQEFFDALGNCEVYDAQAVLNWLGY